MRLTGGAEEVDKRLELVAGQMAELPLVTFADRLIELLEQRQAGVGDADLYDAAVVGHALTDDEAALFKAIDEARDVGGMRDELAGEDKRGECGGMFGAEQAEGVVLLRRQLVPKKKLVLDHPQAVVGPPEIQISFLLWRIETARDAASGIGRHEPQFNWPNKHRPDNYLCPLDFTCRRSAS